MTLYQIYQQLMTVCLHDDIAFQLFLNAGQLYGSQSIAQMIYNRSSMDFGITFQKLFKGRVIDFMHGYKGQGLVVPSCIIAPTECRINVAVPSDRTLRKETTNQSSGLNEPGIIESILDAFSGRM